LISGTVRDDVSQRFDVIDTMLIVLTIDLVLIDQQSMGKRSLHLMGTVNAKERWTTIYWRVNKFLKKSHIVTRRAKERVGIIFEN
jgi:hypothetical protein